MTIAMKLAALRAGILKLATTVALRKQQPGASSVHVPKPLGDGDGPDAENAADDAMDAKNCPDGNCPMKGKDAVKKASAAGCSKGDCPMKLAKAYDESQHPRGFGGKWSSGGGGGGKQPWHGVPGAGNPGTPPASPQQAAIRQAAIDRAASPGKVGGVHPSLAAHGLKAKSHASGNTTYSMPEGSKSVTWAMAKQDLEHKGYKPSQDRNVHVHANGTLATLHPQDNGDVHVGFAKPKGIL